ncbi:MAG: cysteine desulfurase [Candidatus Aenigmatarchaeota archaeon]|nr:cysteine desulfurase [Candidatus Aenigmarchaeota archaeon]
MALKVEKIRQDFPILTKPKPPIYFDNACVTMKPVQVIQAINRYYNEFPACGGRSLHRLGRMVTEEVEKARAIVQKFFGAKNPKEIIFTKNTTEGINLIANSLGLKAGDTVLTTDKEHNSNLIPWQVLGKKGVKHKILPSNPDNTFDLNGFENAMDKSVKLVSMVHTSNLDGVSIPAEEVIKIAHDNGALVLLDAAQSAPHKEIDVRKLDVDFLACSGHKMLGPSGTGILYGKYHLLEQLSPFIVGGDTVIDTTYTTATMEKPPERFEAGLQDYAGIIGLAEATKYLSNIGLRNISAHEAELNKKITDGTRSIAGLKIIGPVDPTLRSGIFSFNISGMDPHDIAMLLDRSAGIAIRSGAHCVHSWFNAHGMKGSARVSLYLYNTLSECDIFIESLTKIAKFIR